MQGSAADAPAPQYAPATHGLHEVAPSASWKRPATHRWHFACRLRALNVPEAHSVGTLDPVGQNVPEPHATHWLGSLRKPSRAITAWSACVPCSQGTGVVAPSTHRLPGVHALHAVAPATSWYRPPAHLVQLALRSVLVNVPGLHGAADVEPVAQLEPAGQGVQLLALARSVVLP